MSDMKCPYCNKPLECKATHISEVYVINLYHCANQDCESTEYLVGCKEFWDILGQLIRTRKALDVALCSLQDIAESNGDFITGDSNPLDEHEYADMMLKEIKRQMKIKTALEQKE